MTFDYNGLVLPFAQVSCVANERGYIVWRRGTGDNVELLHIQAYEKRQGTGKWLVKEMVRQLKANPPYCTVFGFTRTINTEAQQFYLKLGFILSSVRGVYADGDAVLFSQPYVSLLKRFDREDRELLRGGRAAPGDSGSF